MKDKTSTKFTDDEKANILQDQFSSVFTREPEGELPSFSNRTMANIFDIHITEDMVHNEIINLSLNKSCGPDELHQRLLFELVDALSKPIAFLLNNTIRQGVIPRDWKRANVLPLALFRYSREQSPGEPHLHHLQNHGEIRKGRCNETYDY